MNKLLLSILSAVSVVLALQGADEDQIRYSSAYHPHFHEKVKELGFNLVGGGCFRIGWDLVEEKVAPYDKEALAEVARKLEADGIRFIPNFNSGGTRARSVKQKWPRVGRDGKPIEQESGGRKAFAIDAANPAYLASLRKGAEAVAKEYAALGVGNFAGFRGVEEVRLHSEPSFSAASAAAFRAFSGRDIPSEVRGRAAPHWSKVAGMPANRIVPDDFPLLQYYKWFWQTGDGWAAANDAAREGFESVFGRPLVSLYAPGLRMPRLGGIGGKNTHLGEWIYLTPVPFVISYAIAELQANARQTGADVIASVDGIIRRANLAPFKDKLANPPAWAEAARGKNYITVPPDYLREGWWLMMSRQVAGIGLSVGPGVFGLAPGEKHWATPTVPGEAMKALEEGCRAAVMLGPLLRNMPERAPEVAILESYAGAFFAGQAAWDWSTASRSLGNLATAANLPPYALFEEELAKGEVPASVKVVYAPVCDVLTERAADALARFRARGGRVIGSPTLAPGVKADAQLPDVGPLFVTRKTVSGKETDEAIRRQAAALRAVTGLRPYADADNAWLFTFVRTYKDADVVFVVNDRREAGDYIGPWGRALEKGVANRGTVAVARAAGAVYDLVKHERVPFTVEKGQTEIPVSFGTSDGKALMLVSKPLGKIAATVADGTLAVTSPDAAAMIPFGILDAQGKALKYGVLRDGRWNGPAPAGAANILNLADGAVTAL